MTRNLVIVDHFDSFSFNLVEAFERAGCKVEVLRSSAPAAEIIGRAVNGRASIVLSPGPGRPAEAGSFGETIRLAKGRIPLLGICLGHQALVEQAGGTVGPAGAIVHGKSSLIDHDGAGLFEGVPSPMRVGRYHSLCARDVPGCFKVHASLDGMIMAISDKAALQFGLQFHPESILTPRGDRLLRNFLEHGPDGRGEEQVSSQLSPCGNGPAMRL
ncbi:MAG: aminodeoxychorismate/anthranilate synthase component II [Sphingomonas sp.]|nr:aminodeoxychorismate/anthranilate synthase component II [Sphingomonas sp.]